MKKKILLTAALISMFIFAFVIAVSAEAPEQYIEFGAKFQGSDEYITVYTENAEKGQPHINFASYKFYLDEEFTEEVDMSTAIGIDFSVAKTHGCNDSPVTRMTKPSSAFTNCVEVKWFLEGMPCVSYGGQFFKGWTGLKYFDFGNATSVNDNTFESCGFETITIPAQITSLGGSAFKNCLSLTSVTFEGDIAKFNNGATFYGCTALTEVNIDNLTSLGTSMFESCKGLTSFVIPNGVTKIGGNAFYNCTALASVEIPNSVTTIGSNAFRSTVITSVTIPSSVTSVGNEAFRQCGSLTSITIPSSVTTVGNSAFYSCSSLKTVVFEGDDTELGTSMFNGCSKLESIRLPKNLTKIPNSSFWGCKKVVITNISELTKLTTIGKSAFQDSDTLVFTLPDSVTTIESEAFRSAVKSGGSFTINPTSQLQTIGSDAFNDCRKLTSIYIPSTVTSIGSGAFLQTYALTTIENFENCQITEIASKTFQSATKLTYIKIPNTVTTIGENAFHGNEKLAFVYIPDTVTSIADTFTGSQPANAVYIYTGKDASVLSTCTRLAGANVISRDDYDAATTYTGVNLVVHYSNCLAYNNGVHKSIVSTTHVVSYTQPIQIVNKCTACEMMDQTDSIPALFTYKGYSAPETEEGVIGISVVVNTDAIEAYEKLTGETVNYGLFIATEKILGDNDVVDGEGNISEGVYAAQMPSREFSIMTIKINGFNTDAQKAASFAYGAYVIDGDNVGYIQDGTPSEGEKYAFTSYNKVYGKEE